MRPAFPAQNINNASGADIVLAAQSRGTLIAFPYVANILLVEFCHIVFRAYASSFAAWRSSSAVAIGRILFLCSPVKMLWVNAGRIITTMKSVKEPGFFIKTSLQSRYCESYVGGYKISLSYSKNSISAGVFARLPFPTLVDRPNLCFCKEPAYNQRRDDYFDNIHMGYVTQRRSFVNEPMGGR